MLYNNKENILSTSDKIEIFNIDGKLFIEFNSIPNASYISLKMIGVRTLGVVFENNIVASFNISPECIRSLMINNGLWTVMPSLDSDKFIINKFDIAV